MMLENVLVDDIGLKDGPVAVLNSTLYEFSEPRWISLHPGREGHALGPITVLPDKGADKKPQQISGRVFGERQLSIDKGRHLVISYRDKWTINPWTLYALSVSIDFTVSQFKMKRGEHSWEPMGVGVTSGKRLFYYEVFESLDGKDRELVDIEARIKRDPDRYLHQLKSADAVQGTNHFRQLRKAVTPVLVSPEFWSKLLDLGTKLIGRG
jgi:hypothetical protein